MNAQAETVPFQVELRGIWYWPGSPGPIEKASLAGGRRTCEASHGLDGRVGVDDAGNGLVVGLSRLAQNIRGYHLALILADVSQRQGPVTSPIAH
jgi:hypothetical protein